MKKIVIGVACHKPSELPKSSLYLPIHVGAANSNKVLPGLQRDDEGDNISAKNPFYCELTALYWLWKNVDADYYGLCHYRRFMSFAPTRFTNFTDDNRKQVSVNSLNDRTQEMYYLDNEQAMREIIEAHDVVATEEQDLRKVFTPRGRKNSTYAHFAAHDHDLINVNDLDATLAIVKELYPQYFDDIAEYISKPFFRGFNCFVMKKELFNELCKFEFTVLAQLEQHVDMTNYDTTKARLYGFMAEILYSGFLYHLRKRNLADIKDVQMLYFQNTEPQTPIQPVDDAVAICINAVEAAPFMIEPALKSLYQHKDPEKKYDVLVLTDTMTPFFKKYFTGEADKAGNVTLRFLDWDQARDAADDYIEKAPDAPLLYIPWMLNLYEKVLVVDWNTLFKSDCTDLFSTDLEGNLVAAAKDIVTISEANDIYGERRKYLSGRLGLDYWSFFSTNLVLVDTKAIRESMTLEAIASKLASQARIGDREATNAAFSEKVLILPQKNSVFVSNEPLFSYSIQDAPKTLMDEYNAAKSNCDAIHFEEEDPWWPIGEDFELEFWSYVRASELLPYFEAELASVHAATKGERKPRSAKVRRYLDKALPRGSKRRDFVRGAVSQKQYQAIRSFYNSLTAR